MSTQPLVLRDVFWSSPDRVVLDGIDLTVAPGDRVGVVGENGSGKSTLLRIAAGRLQPSAGGVTVPPDVGYLAQDSGLDPRSTVGRVLDEALRPLHEVVRRLERLSAHLVDEAAWTAYDAALEWAMTHGAWDADRRARVAAARLGVERLESWRPVADLSGGERTRLALAALLTRRPGCLVLDEPTNHLDEEALTFLEEELVSLPAAVLVASHDRVLLEGVCTSVVDLDPTHAGTDGHGGRLFTGSYREHLGRKRAARRRWEEAFAAQREQLRELERRSRTTTSDVAHGRGPRDNDRFVHAFKGSRVQATQRRRVRDGERRIERIERDLVPRPPAPLLFSGRLDGPGAGPGPGWADVTDLEVPGRLHLRRWHVDRGEKVLVSGANGSGKSTLLRVLAGELAHRGSVHVRARRARLLAQDVMFPDPGASASSLFGRAQHDGMVPAATSLADLGLLHPRDASRPVGALSLGQQRRVALALVVAARPDLVLLDEPTNHLSLSLVDELEEALLGAPVTVVVASHDRWLRGRWPGRLTELPPR